MSFLQSMAGGSRRCVDVGVRPLLQRAAGVPSAVSRLRLRVAPAGPFTAASRRFMARKAAKTTSTAALDGRASALAAALRQIDSQYGTGTVMKMGDMKAADVDVVSTGSLTLDKALGVGGLPKGRVVEIFGPESSGKTTLALHVVAEAQRAGLACTFIDVEHALDAKYAQALGVDLESLYLSQPDAGEQALEVADTLVRSGAMDVVVLDSVAALVPRAELEGDMGDQHMALQARLMSQALRKLNASMSTTTCLFIFINQIRSKVGVMFGSPEVTAGGNALKYYASVRLDIRRTGQIKDGDTVVGNRTRVKVVKNKVAPPFREAEFDMTYGHGVSKLGELVDVGVDMGFLRKAGAWFSWAEEHGGHKVGQGRERAKAHFEASPEEAARLEDLIRFADADATDVATSDAAEASTGGGVASDGDVAPPGVPDEDEAVARVTVG